MATGTSADPSPPFPPSPRALFGKQILIGEGGKTALRKRKKEGKGGERIGEGKAKKGGICRSSSGRPWSDLSADMGGERGDNPFLPFLFVVNIMIIYIIL